MAEEPVAIVTGGGGGIGRAICHRLSSDGFAVGVLDVKEGETRSVADSLPNSAIPLRADVSRFAEVDSAVGTVLDSFGRVDVLVNNAAIVGDLRRLPFDEILEDDWDLVIAVNLKGTWNCSRAVAPTMRARRNGSIVNISSDMVSSGVPLFAHYTSSKGGINAMTRVLASELGEYQIRVNAIAPGFTLTEGATADPGDAHTRSIERRAIPRAELPEDLVGTVSWLASGDSEFVTGQVVTVNGGYVY